ncbi:hypothetical protein ACFO4P_01295 [Epilithonimonas pallida]|uniref:Uncharacterized protein n=1 Tax=Epilithonimonas pallida TaxID=373671 RepID=A0ABY1R3Q5_9FLAO|nr:hypothetical protein [Epilithonimonas pallida]SMP91939.1 hypothetical protein SAMN05421679_103378 [Epilithonimonas pallida]
MKLKFLKIIILVFLSQNFFAQSKKLPIIKANSLQVDIKDDNKLQKNAWRIVPEEKLDVYTTSAKKVTFYTDVDSISFKINPKVGKYDFVILLNGKDSARLRLNTSLQDWKF